jgi:hypothetical protein
MGRFPLLRLLTDARIILHSLMKSLISHNRNRPESIALPAGPTPEETGISPKSEDHDLQPTAAPQKAQGLPASEVEEQHQALSSTLEEETAVPPDLEPQDVSLEQETSAAADTELEDRPSPSLEEETAVPPDLEPQDISPPSLAEGEVLVNVETEQQQEGHADTRNITPSPLPSLYDRELDPPDYAAEQSLHPHEKLFPDPAHAGQEQHSKLPYGWRIIGASRRGYGHSYDGKYREDDFAIRTLIIPVLQKQEVQVVMVSIADGVGARTYSRYGALAAVEGANHILDEETAQNDLASLVEIVIKHKELPEEIAAEEYENAARSILIRAMKAACDAVQQRAARAKLAPSELHSTLTVLLAIPLQPDCLFVASIQVGDGAIFVKKAGTGKRFIDNWRHIQRPQIQAVGNEVLPLLYSNEDIWHSHFQCEIFHNISCILGMTDGTLDDIAPPYPTPDDPQPDPFQFVDEFAQLIRQCIEQESNMRHAAEALRSFLGYHKPQSFDDRTVIYLYRE